MAFGQSPLAFLAFLAPPAAAALPTRPLPPLLPIGLPSRAAPPRASLPPPPIPSPPPRRPPPLLLAAAATTTTAAAAVGLASSCFGILDQTADELADLLSLDAAPPLLVRTVTAAAPLYAPLKALSPSCTEAVFPEFNEVNDLNDCLLVPTRLFWRGGARPPLLVDQSLRMDSMWRQSTGGAVWGGGVALARYLEGLGSGELGGKRVLELGCGAGLGSITAAKLGAAEVLATDRDGSVLQLAMKNAATNLGEAQRTVAAAALEWGQPNDAVDGAEWDLVIGADVTYNRDSWPLLFNQLRSVRAPALLSASERRADELKSLQAALTDAGFTYRMIDSPLKRGYGATNIKIFRIDAYDGPETRLAVRPQEERLTNEKLAKMSAEERKAALALAKEREAANQQSMARIAAGMIRAK